MLSRPMMEKGRWIGLMVDNSKLVCEANKFNSVNVICYSFLV